MLNGHLYGQDFLLEGIKGLPEWQDISNGEVERLHNELLKIFQPFLKSKTPNEPATEQDCIFPIIKLLGWEFLPQQKVGERRTNVPDGLLFISKDDKEKANGIEKHHKRYPLGQAILENKARGINLDRASGNDEAPSTQILRYLTAAEIQSRRNILWGILTNGCVWRLYYMMARSRSEDFLELDLPAILGMSGHENLFFEEKLRSHWLKIFLLMFRRQSFAPVGLESKTFHRKALDEGESWEAKVAQNLSSTVFNDIFPGLVKTIIAGDKGKPGKLEAGYFYEVKQAALIFLYRLLFILYAEDRNLLPANDDRYDDYGMRKRVRRDIAERMDNKDAFSDKQDKYYHHLKGLFEIIADGDEKLGVPPYNGGLFDATHTKILDRCRLPDTVMADIIDRLSRREERGHMAYINYRDLSVQQLGSIYERLLEFDVAMSDGAVEVQPNVFARKGSGSYYTPEDLVRLIIERAVEPLILERKKVFRDALEKFSKNPDERGKKRLNDLDPATAILDLKICDPAMGSGHFLVSLVDYLADRVLEAMSLAEADGANIVYQSPLKARLHAIRKHILNEAKKHKWLVNEAQLEDRMLVRRMILKRVIYGVDKNPMAVELAKVSLWLHTFTVGAPLSFLDHHLRCGDSLFGEWVRPVMDEFTKRGDLLLYRKINEAKISAIEMRHVEDLTDADIAEVHKSSETFSGISRRTEGLNGFLTMVHALKWVDDGEASSRYAIENFYNGLYGDPVEIIMNGKRPSVPKGIDGPLSEDEKKTPSGKKRLASLKAGQLFPELLAKARRIAEEQKFLN